MAGSVIYRITSRRGLEEGTNWINFNFESSISRVANLEDIKIKISFVLVLLTGLFGLCASTILMGYPFLTRMACESPSQAL